MSNDEDRATDQPMYVRFPVDLHAAVKERAKLDDRTMAQTIRYALRYYLANVQPLPQRARSGD